MVPQQGGSYCSSILQKYSVYSRLAVITKRGFTLKDQYENKKPGLFANRGDEKEMNSKMEKKMPKASSRTTIAQLQEHRNSTAKI